MWLVAQRAVLGSRRVLPQERPALFCMTDITGYIHGRALQQEVIVAIVGVVAIAAGHGAETQWMAAEFKHIRAFFWMTGETGLYLRQGIENPVALCMDLVAGCTGNIFTLVCAAEPPQAPAGFMAAQAYLVLFGCRRLGADTESDRRIAVPTSALVARMFLAGSMAGFALKIRKRCVRVGLRGVFAVEYCGGWLVRSLTMTQHAGVRAAAGVFLTPRNRGLKHYQKTNCRNAE